MRGLCESAKKGHVCCDDLCRGSDVTLCGFDKDFYDEINREFSDEPDYYEDEGDDAAQA